MNIEYTLKRMARARRVKIVVRGERVIVTAPRGLPKFVISRFVQGKQSWIVEMQEKVSKIKKEWVVPEHVGDESYERCKERSRRFVRDRLEHYNQHYKLSYNRISIKKMTSRWGSCSSKKNLNFHYRLLFLPIELADYVIVHELCHLQEMNHSLDFWNLVEETIPDHRPKRKQLKKYLIG